MPNIEIVIDKLSSLVDACFSRPSDCNSLTQLHYAMYENLPSGICCSYVSCGDGWGFKASTQGYYIDSLWNSYELQKLACEHGLAPHVGERETVKIAGFEISGFWTREAITREDMWQELYGVEDSPGIMLDNCEIDEYEYYQDIYIEHQKAMNRLTRGLRAIGISSADLHNENIGVFDGELVAIDFSHESSS